MWEIDINDQLLTAAYSAVLGVLLCLFYDILRAARKAGLNSPWAVFAEDILFWVISAFATFIFLLARTNGEIRGYVLLSMLAGFIISRLTLSKVVLFILTKILKAAVAVYRFISLNILRFCIIISSNLHTAVNFFAKKAKTAGKYAKKLLKSAWQVVYTKENNLNTE